MTAVTAPAHPHEDAKLRPVPWRRMAWITWRQHRPGLTALAATLGALAVCLWVIGLGLHHAYAAATACHPASSGPCSALVGSFNGMDGLLANGFVLQVVPALIGAFVGGPVLARELETGTFRYAWTQGFGRWRWTLAKLVLLSVVVAAAAGALSVLLSWYYHPYFQPYLAGGNQISITNESSPLALEDCSTSAGSRSPPGRSPPSRSAAWPGRSSAGLSLRSPPPWPFTPVSPSSQGASCASTTRRRC